MQFHFELSAWLSAEPTGRWHETVTQVRNSCHDADGFAALWPVLNLDC